jgi:hypothetical protein
VLNTVQEPLERRLGEYGAVSRGHSPWRRTEATAGTRTPVPSVGVPRPMLDLGTPAAWLRARCHGELDALLFARRSGSRDRSTSWSPHASRTGRTRRKICTGLKIWVAPLVRLRDVAFREGQADHGGLSP